MHSIGDLIDKLIIENIKIFTLRDKLHAGGLSDDQYVHLNNSMITLNENRGILCNALDEKVAKVVSGTERNVVLKKIKTYDLHGGGKK